MVFSRRPFGALRRGKYTQRGLRMVNVDVSLTRLYVRRHNSGDTARGRRIHLEEGIHGGREKI